MKTSSVAASRVVSLLCLLLLISLSASAREVVLPAGTLLQCTLNEPNLSSATVAIGDPVLCHLRSMTSFGQQAFPRGSYLVGHLEAAEEPGHFWGKGNLKLQFDRIGLPTGDVPLEAKVVGTRGYKVDKEGDIRGKGHAKRDIVEWLLPPLWPWKIIMLPARGPRPTLKGESQLTLRLMDDVQIPQAVAQTFGPDWHFFGRPQSSLENDAYLENSSYHASLSQNAEPRLLHRDLTPVASEAAVGERMVTRPMITRPMVRQPVVEEVPAVTYTSYTPARPAAAVLTAPLVSSSASRFASTAPGVPLFVLKTGTVLAVGNYTYHDNRISYELASGGNGVISSDEVDWTTTTQVNMQRGVRVTLRGGHVSASAVGL